MDSPLVLHRGPKGLEAMGVGEDLLDLLVDCLEEDPVPTNEALERLVHALLHCESVAPGTQMASLQTIPFTEAVDRNRTLLPATSNLTNERGTELRLEELGGIFDDESFQRVRLCTEAVLGLHDVEDPIGLIRQGNERLDHGISIT